ncbi:MAG TPA: VOC family protein [Patescibacteria group bacterium]|nr:VOC family protein [Patescibacteria group bacterium]
MSKRLLSHLAHVELLTPKLDESAAFFTETLGLIETGRVGDSVYLRCWDEYYHHSVVLTAAKQPALGHAAWRTEGPEELQEAVSRLESSGTRGAWIDKSVGHGRAYRFLGPSGHTHEVFWEVERYVPPDDLKSSYPDRPQRFTGRGIAPRQLDHVTMNTQDVMKTCEWYRDVLGFRFMAYTSLEPDPGPVIFGVVTTNEKSHDLGFGGDMSPVRGRLHHLAFWVESQEALLRGADILLESGTEIEFGPGKHGIGEQGYLYFREPSGLRLELNTGGYRNYIPDWQPSAWKIAQGANVMFRNYPGYVPPSFMEAFPPAPEPVVPELGMQPAAAGGPKHPAR